MDELLEAGVRAGGSPPELEDWTWGEVLQLIRCRREAERQQCQALSVIAWEQAVFTARLLAGERAEPVYERFPFWEESEQASLRLAGYRSMMERLVGNKREVREHE